MKKMMMILLTLLVICMIIVASVIGVNQNRKKYGIIEIERGIATATDNIIEYEIEDENIIKFDHMENKRDTKKNEKELGGTKKEQYYFVGVNEGSTYIRFTKKSDDGRVSDTCEYEVKVDKNLNVKIKKESASSKISK